MRPSESQPGLVIETRSDVQKTLSAFAHVGHETETVPEIGDELNESAAFLAIDGLRAIAREERNFFLCKSLKHPIRYMRSSTFNSTMQWHRDKAKEYFERADEWQMYVTKSIEMDDARSTGPAVA